MRPTGNSALIPGGKQRIGKAISPGLAQAGANVIINDNNSATEARKTVSEVRSSGVGTLIEQANIGGSH